MLGVCTIVHVRVVCGSRVHGVCAHMCNVSVMYVIKVCEGCVCAPVCMCV